MSEKEIGAALEEWTGETKRPDLVTLIAIWHLFSAALCLLAIAGLGIGLTAVIVAAVGEDALVGGSFLAFFILMAGFGLVLNVAVGWGLLKMKDWARWTSVVLSVFALLNFPLGTVTGALRIWYFLTPEARDAFE